MDGSGKGVAVFGAGIAGLTAAHELAHRGYRVSVYESRSEAGGFFRSTRLRDRGDQPSEYSWHGMGPWYHNTFDLLKQIPFDAHGSIFERGLSRPIDFGILPDHGTAQFYDRRFRSVPAMFEFSALEWMRWIWLMLKTWTAHERSLEYYARINAARAWRPLLGDRGYQLWRACFGPWIGSDWTNVSLHTVGHFFRKQLLSDRIHAHPADGDGPAWDHGAGDGWLLLRGPSSEAWFDRWLAQLTRRGVVFHWNSPLTRLVMVDHRISHAQLASGRTIEADHFILAVNPFAAAEIIERSDLQHFRQLHLFKPLTQDGPHVQVSFRLAFRERIQFPRPRTAMVLGDTEFNLTLFAQEQAWHDEVSLGDDIGSLWTGTSCVATVPGRVHGLPVMRCSRDQFIDEIRAQVFSCGSLQRLVREANAGRDLASFTLLHIEVWHEWMFSEEGIAAPQPKWVNTTRTQEFAPDQTTPIANLFLAGAHTRTDADVWSIEAAVESGRRAARGVDPAVTVIRQYTPPLLRRVARLDDSFYRLGAPHLLDVVLAAGVAAGALAIAFLTWWCLIGAQAPSSL